jgi:hypothetical protein
MPRGQHPNSRAALEATRQNYPPAPPNNTRRLKHGAYSRRAIRPMANAYAAEFERHLDESSGEEWTEFCSVLGRCFARLDALGVYLDLRSEDFSETNVTLLKLEQSLRNEATAGLERLRMAPLAPGDESTRLRFLLDMQARLDAIEQRGRQPSADKGGS